MTNSFADIADPAILRALVQDGVMCNDCCNKDRCYSDDEPCTHYYRPNCPTCDGSGHTPLSNANLDALAACWCEGWVCHPVAMNADCRWECPAADIKPITWHPNPPAYTVSSAAAMRLQVKYKMHVHCMEDGKEIMWGAIALNSEDFSEHKSLCRAITTAALVAALTEMKGDSDAGD